MGLLLATLIFYLDILWPDRILADYDVWTYFYPLRDYAVFAIQNGRFPLWNPDTFLGAPFFANPQTALLYPASWIFLLLPVPYAYSISVLLHTFLTAAAAYWFLRSVMGVHAWPGLIGATAFAFSGPLLAQIGHLNQLSATLWLPLVVTCADHAYRRRSLLWCALGALALAAQLLAGHAQISYMTGWVLGLLLIWRIADEVRTAESDTEAPPLLRRLLRSTARAGAVGAAVGVPALALAAAQLIPTAELSGESIRGGGLSYLEATAFSLPPQSLFRALLPGYWANLFSEYQGWVGTLPLFFAVLALAFAGGSRTAFAAGLALLGLFLALGGANPAYGLLYQLVPGFDLFRVPSRWLLIYAFGAASLAALGFEWLLARPVPHPSIWRAPTVLGLFSLCAVLFVPFATEVPPRIVLLWVVTLVGGGLLACLALREPTRIVAAAGLLLSLSELRGAAQTLPVRAPVPQAAYTELRPLPLHLIQHPDGRVLSIAPTEYEVEDAPQLAERFPGLDPAASLAFRTVLKLDEVMSPNVSLRYGLSSVDGYDGGILPLRRYLDLASLLVPSENLRPDGVLRTRLVAIPETPLLDLFHIRWVIANQVNDVDLGGVHFDTATARRLRPGTSLVIDLPSPVDAGEIAFLASAAGENSGGGGGGTLTLARTDGSRANFPLAWGNQVRAFADPGPIHARRRTVLGLNGDDTLVRLPLDAGAPINQLRFTWQGPTDWEIRAVSLIGRNGGQEAVLMQPGLRRTFFPPLKLYEHEASVRVVNLVLNAIVMNDADAIEALRTDPESSAQVVYVDGPPALQLETGSGLSQFTRLADSPEQVVFARTNGAGSGYLTFTDAYFPGWKAWVDDAETPIFRADGFFKAVWVPAETSQVRFSYEPLSVRIGLAVSLFGFASILGLLFFARRGRTL